MLTKKSEQNYTRVDINSTYGVIWGTNRSNFATMVQFYMVLLLHPSSEGGKIG